MACFTEKVCQTPTKCELGQFCNLIKKLSKSVGNKNFFNGEKLAAWACQKIWYSLGDNG